MSLLLLKKKIIKELDSSYSVEYRAPGFLRVLQLIDELEKEELSKLKYDDSSPRWIDWSPEKQDRFVEEIKEIAQKSKEKPCEHYMRDMAGRLIYCDRNGDHERFGHTFPLGAFPVPWSGRSEKEIRERIEELRKRFVINSSFQDEKYNMALKWAIDELEWVLSKEKDTKE